MTTEIHSEKCDCHATFEMLGDINCMMVRDDNHTHPFEDPDCLNLRAAVQKMLMETVRAAHLDMSRLWIADEHRVAREAGRA